MAAMTKVHLVLLFDHPAAASLPPSLLRSCGNMAAIMEVDEHMNKSFSQVGLLALLARR